MLSSQFVFGIYSDMVLDIGRLSLLGIRHPMEKGA